MVSAVPLHPGDVEGPLAGMPSRACAGSLAQDVGVHVCWCGSRLRRTPGWSGAQTTGGAKGCELTCARHTAVVLVA